MREFEDLIKACEGRVRPDPFEYPASDYPWGIKEVAGVDELIEAFQFGNWSVRTGFVLEDLAFVEQVSGGNEWLALRQEQGEWKPFDSISFYHMLEQNGADACREYLDRLRGASPERSGHSLTLYFPASVTLFHGEASEQDQEPYMTRGVSQRYVDAINQAFLEQPEANAAGSSRPSLVYVGDTLYGMVEYSVGSAAPLPESAIDALKEDLGRQLADVWGETGFDVPISDAVLYYNDGHPCLVPRQDLPERDGGGDVPLRDASFNVRFTEADLQTIYSLDELESRIAWDREQDIEPTMGMV